MYQVLGRQVTKNKDNTFTVKAEIIDDRIAQTVRFQLYTASSMSELKAAIRADLKTLQDAETDATLSAAIVGVLLVQL